MAWIARAPVAATRGRVSTLRASIPTIPALAVVLVTSFALRLALFPIAGFETDHGAMRNWVMRLVEHPLSRFYATGFADHLPGDLWILWLLGQIHHLVDPTTPPADLPVAMLKIVPSLADTAIALLLFVLGRRFAGPKAGLIAATVFAFNPGPVFLAGIWGQWDALSASFVLLALWLFLRGNPEWAFPALIYATLVKPPFAALLPIFLLATLRGFILPHTRFAAGAPPPEPLHRTLRRAAIAAGASLVVALAVLLPFNVGFPPLPTDYSIFERVRFAVDVYQVTTVNTFTICWPLTWNWAPDNQTFAGITYETWGSIFVAVAYLAILWRFWTWQRRDAERALIWACLATPLMLFVLPTRGHERYLYPAVMMAALIAAIAPRLRWLAIALALTFFANIYFIWFLYYDPPAPRLIGFPIFANTVSWLNVALLGYVLIRALPVLTAAAASATPDELTTPAGSRRLNRAVAPLLARATPVWTWTAATPARLAQTPVITRVRPRVRPLLATNALVIVIPVLLFVAALGLRLVNLHNPGAFYFDEVYFVTASREYARGNEDAHFFYVNADYGHGYEWTHPPLGKLIQATSILIGGNQSFAWRMMQALAGSIGVVVVYLLAFRITGRIGVATLTAGLLLTDTLYLAMTRIGTVDAFVVLFTMSAMLAFYGFLTAPPTRVAWPLIRLGVLLGLGISTKWNAAYGAAIVGLVVLWRVAAVAWRWWRTRHFEGGDVAWAALRAHLIWVPIGMALVPAAIYVLTYVPFFVTGNGRSWGDFLQIQRSMFDYHSGVVPSHIYRSRWWEWPLGLGRMWLSSDRSTGDGMVRSIYVNINPLLGIASVPAVAWVAWQARRKPSPALVTLLVGFFGQWMIWAVSPRSESFIYHFLPMVPFGCLAIALWLEHLWQGNRPRRTIAALFLTAVVLVFVFYYPLVTALPLTEAQTSTRTWFDDWWRNQWGS